MKQIENIKKPLISIITPCYNSEEYIGRYLDSILKQTYKKIQVILINDGSEDKTEKIIYSYRQKLEDNGIIFTYLSQENKGIGGAINSGLKLIQGEFFTWCDSDNFFADNYLQKCVEFLNKNKECVILRCDAYTVLENDLQSPINRFSDGNYEKFKRDLFDNAIMEKNFHFGCALLKTSAFDKVVKDREIYESRAGQNWQLLLPMFFNYEADYIDEPLFYFVERKDSVSNIVYHQSFEALLLHLDEHKKILLETIKHLPVNQIDYSNKIEVKYIKRKLHIASDYQNEKAVVEYYQLLKEKNNFNILDTIMFCRGKYKFAYILYSFGKRPFLFSIKIRRKVINAFNKNIKALS